MYVDTDAEDGFCILLSFEQIHNIYEVILAWFRNKMSH